jgi:hypothetical protein
MKMKMKIKIKIKPCAIRSVREMKESHPLKRVTANRVIIIF